MRLSVSNLAEFVGSSASYINKLENRKTANPGLPLIESIAALFGVTVDQLRNVDLRNAKQTDITIQRLKTNFTETEIELIASMVEGITVKQAHNGQFRSAAYTTPDDVKSN